MLLAEAARRVRAIAAADAARATRERTLIAIFIIILADGFGILGFLLLISVCWTEQDGLKLFNRVET